MLHCSCLLVLVRPSRLLRSFSSFRASCSVWVRVGSGVFASLRQHWTSSLSVWPSFSFSPLAICSVLAMMSSTITLFGAVTKFRPKARTLCCASVSCWLLWFGLCPRFPTVSVSCSALGKQTSSFVSPSITRVLCCHAHHHPQVKTSVVSCLKSRAERVCTGDDHKEELNHLSRVFLVNGYPHAVTARVLNKRRRPRTAPSNNDRH